MNRATLTIAGNLISAAGAILLAVMVCTDSLQVVHRAVLALTMACLAARWALEAYATWAQPTGSDT
ncbi:hypothetical protein [Planctomycetes bacterium TBK1r]|uniref:GGDEF domain-containing protein n=1 Tax=Stieleria magnilauensis TaxID=2527963 RepID=A0ABX5Y206_9BACT|nr:hypothetical protein TBK1r_59980 [Planctomycetes bacterium TBK1r]QDV87049.1 hypothetical protein TBK1r_60760 [Planctomycetes bacterium TBK1r]